MQDSETSVSIKKACLLSIASAALLALSMPGLGLWPLAFLSLVPWGWASLRVPRRPWWIDATFALSFLSFSVWWIGYVSWVGALFTILVEASLMLPLGWMFRRLVRWMPATLALPIAWCVVEFLRTRYPYGGLPFSVLGFAVWEQGVLIQFAGVAGVHGVSFLLAACSGFAIDTFSSDRKFPWRMCAASLGLLWTIGLLPRFLTSDPEEAQGPLPRVLAIQANIPAEAKGRAMSAQEVFERHVRLSQKALLQHPETDLLIWPESMFPFFLAEGGEPDEAIFPEPNAYTRRDADRSEEGLRSIVFEKLLRGKAASFLTGAIVYLKGFNGWSPRNSALLLRSPKGERAGLYHKIHLVPGGEFVPNLGPISLLAEWLSGLEGFRGQMGTLEPGEQVVVMSFPGDSPRWKFGVSICYDNAYADLYREATQAGAQFHVVLSNEGWYGYSPEMDQLLAASVFRAVETGRPFLRATNSGISALISSTGRVISLVQDANREKKHVEGWIAATIPSYRADPTFYVRWGDVPFWALAVVSLLLSALPRKKGNFRPDKD